jgi:hypothetical protein
VHNILPDMPPQNVLAMFEALIIQGETLDRYGSY